MSKPMQDLAHLVHEVKWEEDPWGLNEEAKRKAKIASDLYKAKELTANEICSTLGTKSNATFYRYQKHQGVEVSSCIQL